VSDERTHHEGLRQDLVDLADRTALDLGQRRAWRAATVATRRFLPLLAVVPSVVLLVAAGVWLFGSTGSLGEVGGFGGWLSSFVVLALLAVLPLLAVVVFRAWRAHEGATSRPRALAVLDRHLGLSDRLVTADEFLALEGRGGFEQAAVEDAAEVVSTARGAILPQVGFAWPSDRRSLGVVAGAVALISLAALVDLGSLPGVGADEEEEREHTEEEIASADARGRGVRTGGSESEVTVVTEPRDPREKRPQAAVRADAKATEVPDRVKQSKGATREGESSDAQASSGAGSAKGSPSNQEQESKGEAQAKQEPKKPKESNEARDDEAPDRKKADEDSGSTAGRGSAKGSNKNAVATPWSSKDQVDTPDDQEIDDDDEFEDDAEEQKARGGMQPNLRDRRPPVSRDLNIGFGNRPNPDANGRGGPSQQKKSRGTASLVLGVPVPDRVKGQPNRGKTKITQERVEPRAETSESVAAGARTPSSEPLGRVPSPHMSPWERDAVRRFFLALRARDASTAN